MKKLIKISAFILCLALSVIFLSSCKKNSGMLKLLGYPSLSNTIEVNKPELFREIVLDYYVEGELNQSKIIYDNHVGEDYKNIKIEYDFVDLSAALSANGITEENMTYKYLLQINVIDDENTAMSNEMLLEDWGYYSTRYLMNEHEEGDDLCIITQHAPEYDLEPGKSIDEILADENIERAVVIRFIDYLAIEI